MVLGYIIDYDIYFKYGCYDYLYGLNYYGYFGGIQGGFNNGLFGVGGGVVVVFVVFVGNVVVVIVVVVGNVVVVFVVVMF